MDTVMNDDEDAPELTADQMILLGAYQETVMRMTAGRIRAFMQVPEIIPGNQFNPDDQFPHLLPYPEIGFSTS